MQPLLALMARSAAKKAAPTILASIIGGYTIGQMAAEVEEKGSSLPNELLKAYAQGMRDANAQRS